MGVSKSDIFSKEQNEFAKLAKAIAHPARIAILEMLCKSNTCICNDIVAEIGLSQATVSQHLKELKNACIIKGEVDPPRVCYCINQDTMEKINQLINTLCSAAGKCC